MIFSISSSLLFLATLAAALPSPADSSSSNTLQSRQTRLRRRAPIEVNKLYEHSPNVWTAKDGWGETSKAGTGRTAVNTLIAFQTQADDFGKQCNLRFAKPDILAGPSSTFQLWEFIPTTGPIYNAKTATWNSRTGKRASSTTPLATHTYRANGPDLVYSMPCPSGGKVLNYELSPAGTGDSNMQWFTPSSQGLYLEVATPIVIAMKDQAQMFQARPSSGSGSIQFGEVAQTAATTTVGAHQTTTLIAFVMPAGTSYASRQCRLRFANPTSNTGAKKFVLWEFVPSGGRLIFRSDTASWSNKGGVRGKQLAVHSVVSKAAATVYSFPCPAPGKAVNYEMAPTGGAGKISWNTAGSPAGGLSLEVL